MKEANKKRILWIDYAKAFAMFFVVIGHVNSGNYLTNWIALVNIFWTQNYKNYSVTA